MIKTSSMNRFFVVFFACLLLASCTVPSHRINTPETSSLNHMPETRDLKSWQKPYVVAGKRYDPLLDCRGYTEKGLASWYGRDFHGRKTSNGEIYNMHAMTAAHKTLPLGIFVKVKNLRNGREAVVRLNDRGPFVDNRVIDLSYSAAKKIDIVGPGTAPVRIEVLGVPSTEKRTGKIVYQTPALKEISGFAVQVGAFSASENARQFAGRLGSRFGPANIQSIGIKGKRFYRVQVGRYPSMEAAEEARLHIQRRGYPHSFVVALD